MRVGPLSAMVVSLTYKGMGPSRIRVPSRPPLHRYLERHSVHTFPGREVTDTFRLWAIGEFAIHKFQSGIGGLRENNGKIIPRDDERVSVDMQRGVPCISTVTQIPR